MPITEEALARLAAIPGLTVLSGAPLADRTRFGIGGPARFFAETGCHGAFAAALGAAREAALPTIVIGGGTNLIVSDEGFAGLVLRYTEREIRAAGDLLTAGSGAVLDMVVDFANCRGLAGLETFAGIPGWLGGAVYGNAGAYGHAIGERVERVAFFDGESVRDLDAAGCEFAYRESVFKRRKDWIVLSATLRLAPGDAAALAASSASIRATRDAKFPPTMKCAGSVFKNLLLRDLPPAVAALIPAAVVREGKVPAAWFLEQVGAKGIRRGDIMVADYHANLIFNTGAGSARDLCALIADLKRRVRARFGIALEEEVQYVG